MDEATERSWGEDPARLRGTAARAAARQQEERLRIVLPRRRIAPAARWLGLGALGLAVVLVGVALGGGSNRAGTPTQTVAASRPPGPSLEQVKVRAEHGRIAAERRARLRAERKARRAVTRRQRRRAARRKARAAEHAEAVTAAAPSPTPPPAAEAAPPGPAPVPVPAQPSPAPPPQRPTEASPSQVQREFGF